MIPNRATHRILQNGANLWISKGIKRICANVFARKPNTVTKALSSLVEKNQRDIPNHPLNQLNPFCKIKPLEVNISLYWKLDNILQLFLLAKMLLCSTNQQPPQPPTPSTPVIHFTGRKNLAILQTNSLPNSLYAKIATYPLNLPQTHQALLINVMLNRLFFILLMNM